jgi:hypothetical protein
MSVICPICEGNVDWGEGKCPHSIDDIVQTLYLEIKGLSHVAEDQRTSLVAENDTLRKQLKLAREILNDTVMRVNGLYDNPNIPPPMYQLINLTANKLNDALSEINWIGGKHE